MNRNFISAAVAIAIAAATVLASVASASAATTVRPSTYWCAQAVIAGSGGADTSGLLPLEQYGNCPFGGTYTAPTAQQRASLAGFTSLRETSSDGPGDALAKRMFRGWGQTRTTYACSVVGSCAQPVAVSVWRYGSTGWVRATLAINAWVQIEPWTKPGAASSTTWHWAYSGGAWYAVEGAQLSGYCHAAPNAYSNCTASWNEHANDLVGVGDTSVVHA